MIEFLDCFGDDSALLIFLKEFSVMAKWLWCVLVEKENGFAGCSCAIFGKMNG
jgi:hypothetical protein